MTQTIIYLSVKHLLKTTTTCPQYLPQLDKIPDTPSPNLFPLKTQITKYIKNTLINHKQYPNIKSQHKTHNQYTKNQNLTKTITSRKAATITPPKIKNSTHQITTQIITPVQQNASNKLIVMILKVFRNSANMTR